MYRNTTILLFLTCLASIFVSQPSVSQSHISIKYADSLLVRASDADRAATFLESLEKQASTEKQKCAIHWRMARVLTVKGEETTDKNLRKAFYQKGTEYASAAVREDPSEPQGYMWHCACIGRECQMKPLLKQAAAVPVMMKDLTFILDTLERTSLSEAWQAMAEIYFHHPFKSTDSAINFMRQALRTIPDEELRLSSYLFMAEMLYERNWSAERRSESITRNASRYGQSDSNVENCSYLDGMLGPDHIPVWSARPSGSISDREEASDIIGYAIRLYKKTSDHSPADKKDYNKLTAAAASFNK